VSPIAAAKGSAKAKKTGLSVASGLMNKEYLVYTQQLRYHPGLPVVPRDAYGQDDHFAWLVMQKMAGGTVQHKMDAQPNGALSWKTTATIAMQLISILAHVHSKGHVFLDLKADNVMISGPQPTEGLNAANTAFKDGKGSKSAAETAALEEGIRHPTEDRVYLVDFGVCDRYKGFDGSAKPATGNGSPIFTSLASVRGWTTGPGEDMESLGYLLIYMLRGCKGGNLSLPWSRASSLDEVNKIKLSLSTSSHLSSTVPPEAQKPVKAFLDKVLNVQPTHPIDYQSLYDILRPHASHDGRLDFTPSMVSTTKSPGKRKFGASSPPSLSSSHPSHALQSPNKTTTSSSSSSSSSSTTNSKKRSAPSVSPSDTVERQPPLPRKVTKKTIESVAVTEQDKEVENVLLLARPPPSERKRKVFSAKKGAAVATAPAPDIINDDDDDNDDDVLAKAMKQASEDRQKRASRRSSASDLLGSMSKAIGSLLIW